MKNLFISRSLEENLLKQLEERDFDVIHKSLLNFQPIVFQTPPGKPDWIFFYSKNGIKYFFEAIGYNSQISYGVMGVGSARYFESVTNHTPDYIATKPGSELIETLNTLFENAVIWAPQGIDSIHFLEQLDSPQKLYAIQVYQNTKATDINIADCTHLAFTSPLNVESYFEKYEYKGECIFAIGATTAARIEQITSEKPIFPKEPGIQNLIDLIIKNP